MAFCRVIKDDAAVPGPELAETIDLLLISAVLAGPWVSIPGRATDTPLLISGRPDELADFVSLLNRQNVDFVNDGCGNAEVLFRAAVLLSGGPGPARPRRKPLVVAADDERSITALVKAVLASDGIDCETGSTGGEALELARRLKPDVMVLDVNMPQMGGFEVLAAIKQDPVTARIRVILLTGAEQESDIMRGFSLGVSDYVVKPFNPMELLVRIRRFLRT